MSGFEHESNKKTTKKINITEENMRITRRQLKRLIEAYTNPNFTFKFDDPDIQSLIDEFYEQINSRFPDADEKIRRLDSVAKLYGYDGGSYYADRSGVAATTPSDRYTDPGGQEWEVFTRELQNPNLDDPSKPNIRSVRRRVNRGYGSNLPPEDVEIYFPNITAVLGTPQSLENKMLEQESEGMSTVEIVGSDVDKAFEGNMVGKPYSRMSSSNYPNFTFRFEKDEHPEYSWRVQYYGSADYIEIERK